GTAPRRNERHLGQKPSFSSVSDRNNRTTEPYTYGQPERGNNRSNGRPANTEREAYEIPRKMHGLPVFAGSPIYAMAEPEEAMCRAGSARLRPTRLFGRIPLPASFRTRGTGARP